MTTTVYESAALPTSRGGTVALRLLLTSSGHSSTITIECTERLPHKVLQWVVLAIADSTGGLEPLARAMTTITHELERLHGQGYTLRQRAVGGWRGAWHAELVSPQNSRTVMSWEIELRKPTRTLEPLASALVALNPPTPQPDRATDDHGSVVAAMRARGGEIQRTHAIDALIASDPLMPADELLEELRLGGCSARSTMTLIAITSPWQFSFLDRRFATCQWRAAPACGGAL